MLNNIFYAVHTTIWTGLTCAIMIPRLVQGQQPTPTDLGWCAVAFYALCLMWAFTLNLIYNTEQE